MDADVVRIEQDILRPLANSKQLYVFETLEFWIQIKTARYLRGSANAYTCALINLS